MISEDFLQSLVGQRLPKPVSGNLSGHAAGEPFDQCVYQVLKQQYQGVFRQHEYLNDLYLKNPKHITLKERQQLFESPTVMFLLSRGKEATEHWNEQQLFSEKQNDTADILIKNSDDGYYYLLDVKTKNAGKKSQPPNIISAYKLAQLCALMIDNQDYAAFSLNYLQVDWQLDNDFLVIQKAYQANLFQCSPSDLYINWAAAMQVQFQVAEVDQSFDQGVEAWARAYLSHFVGSAKARAAQMIEKFVKPFEKYL
jgi:type II restriction enzyme